MPSLPTLANSASLVGRHATRSVPPRLAGTGGARPLAPVTLAAAAEVEADAGFNSVLSRTPGFSGFQTRRHL